MGSVPAVYTTGDNDPEIEPESYYRHYLYCDDCGSFDLAGWTTPETPRDLTLPRRRLRIAAALAAALAFVAGWEAFGLFPSPVIFAVVVTAIAARLVFDALAAKWVSGLGSLFPRRMRFFRGAAIVLLVLALAQWIVVDLFYAPLTLLIVSAVIAVALLYWAVSLEPLDEVHGLVCRRCGARYPSGSDFFRNLGANPRNLTIDDVPRPLGSSPYEVGEPAPSTPPEVPSRLPG